MIKESFIKKKKRPSNPTCYITVDALNYPKSRCSNSYIFYSHHISKTNTHLGKFIKKY